MAFVQICAHAVWSTKNRDPILRKPLRDKICQHIIENAKAKDFFIDCINGYTEHLHCLMTINADLSVSKQMQLIKGESSFWINKNKLFQKHFEWGDEYFATSVNVDKLNKVRAYIADQEGHHRQITFLEEYNNFLKHFGLFKSQG